MLSTYYATVMINFFARRLASITVIIFAITFLLAQKESEIQEEEIIQIKDALVAWNGHDYVVLTIPPSALEFFLERGDKKFKNFKALSDDLKTKNKELIFAMNGGMYLPEENNEPQGLYIEHGKVRTELDTLTTVRAIKTNFYLHPNGVFYINNNNKAFVQTNSGFQSLYPSKEYQDLKFATQSGPMLVYNNSIHKAFTLNSKNRHYRNAVGIKKDGTACFVLSKEKICFHDMATLFRDKLECANALYLDGFVSRLYYPTLLEYQNLNQGNFGVLIGVVN
jgi:uncharacterized protein YigE (DUF2233 family)